MHSLSVPTQAGTGAGAAGSMAPSLTSTPTAAWVMLFAVLHEIRRVSASIGPPGPNAVSGAVP